MDKNIQDSAREKIIANYQERAFEMLALYSYWGNKYAEIDKQLTGMEDRKKVIGGEIFSIEGSPDYHTVENKNKLKLLRKDIQDYDARMKGVGEMANNLMKKASGFREEGLTILEQIEYVREFKFKTPEEIEADKAKVGQKS